MHLGRFSFLEIHFWVKVLETLAFKLCVFFVKFRFFKKVLANPRSVCTPYIVRSWKCLKYQAHLKVAKSVWKFLAHLWPCELFSSELIIFSFFTNYFFLFQVNLPENFRVVVGGFRRAWLALRRHTLISEINSIHVILAHLEDYLQMSGESLVKVSDETGEAAHKWLDQVLDRTGARVKDLTSDIHGERLYRAIMTHNCYAARSMRIRLE